MSVPTGVFVSIMGADDGHGGVSHTGGTYLGMFKCGDLFAKGNCVLNAEHFVIRHTGDGFFSIMGADDGHGGVSHTGGTYLGMFKCGDVFAKGKSVLNAEKFVIKPTDDGFFSIMGADDGHGGVSHTGGTYLGMFKCGDLFAKGKSVLNAEKFVIRSLENGGGGGGGGKALIVCIRQYPGKQNRGPAVIKEVKYAEQICKNFGCEYRTLTDAYDGMPELSEKRIANFMMDHRKWLEDADYAILIATGHGSLGSLMSTDDVPMSEMQDFERVLQGGLGGRPKIYFYQHCMGDSTNRETNKHTDSVAMPTHLPRRLRVQNSFRYYATAQDFYAYRTQGDSPFLRAVAAASGRAEVHGKEMSVFEKALVDEFNGAFDQVPQVSKDVGAVWVVP